MIFVIDSKENIVGKGENAGDQHFLLLLQYFQKASFYRVIKITISLTWLKHLQTAH